MNTTKIISEAVGVQWQGLQDRTEVDIAPSQTSAVIVGRFKRGTLYKLMSINNSNIRSQLGYDPKNPDYIAVQECLDAGVPNLNVVRIGTKSESCKPTFITSNYYGGIGAGGGKAGINYQINGGEMKLAWWEDNLTGGAADALLRAFQHDESLTPFPADHFKFTTLTDPVNSELNALKINGYSENHVGFVSDPMTVRLLRDSSDVGRWWLWDYLFPDDIEFVDIHSCGYVPIQSIHVEFSDGAEIIDASSVVIIGSVLNAVTGDNIELTISGTGSSNVLTNVVVQSDLTFTTAALDLSGFDAGSDVTVTASKLNGSTTGFVSDTAMANLPDILPDNDAAIFWNLTDYALPYAYQKTEPTNFFIPNDHSFTEIVNQDSLTLYDVKVDGVFYEAGLGITRKVGTSAWRTVDFDVNSPSAWIMANMPDKLTSFYNDGLFIFNETNAQIDIEFIPRAPVPQYILDDFWSVHNSSVIIDNTGKISFSLLPSKNVAPATAMVIEATHVDGSGLDFNFHGMDGNITIDWGDGTVDTVVPDSNNYQYAFHEWTGVGVKTVTVSGRVNWKFAAEAYSGTTINVTNFGNLNNKYFTFAGGIRQIPTVLPVHIRLLSQAFQEANSGFVQDLTMLDTSEIYSFNAMFFLSGYNQPINFDASKAISFQDMCRSMPLFNKSVTLSNSVNCFSTFAMFEGSPAYNSALNINTVNVRDARRMLRDAINFNQTFNADFSNVLIAIRMLRNANKFNGDTSSFGFNKLRDATEMLRDCTQFTGIGASNWRLPELLYANAMVMNCPVFNPYVNDWGIQKVVIAIRMFMNGTAFNQPINNFNLSNATHVGSMLESCINFNGNMTGLRLNNVAETPASGSYDGAFAMLYHCYACNQDLSSWCVPLMTTAPDSFASGAPLNSNPAFLPVWGTCPIP